MTRGTIFEHKHWLDNKNMPMICVVTAVRDGEVYWRQWQTGSAKGLSYRFDLNNADRYVGQILEAA